MNLPRHDADRGLHARGVDLDIHEAKQVANMPLGAMTMQTLEAADRPTVVGLEVGRAAVYRARVLVRETQRSWAIWAKQCAGQARGGR